MARKLGSTTIPECLAVQKSLLGINLGVGEYKLSAFKRGDTVTRVRLIAKTPDSKKAIQLGSAEKQLRKTCDGLLDVEVAGENTLDLRFAEKQRPGRKAKDEQPTKATKKTARKNSDRKKRVARKVGHRKVAGNGKGRKRLPELRLPRNMGHKSHVKAVFGFLNGPLFTDTMRAECVEVIAKFATNTPSCKKYENLLAKLNGKIVLDPKTNKQISESIFKKLKEHSIKLVEPHRKPRKRRAKRA